MSMFEYSEAGDLTFKSFKDGICLYLVTYEESEQGNFDRLDVFMTNLKTIGELACQKVVFGFGGYDNDSREIYTVDKARHYMQETVSKYPCFGYFVAPADSALFACLLPLQNILNGTIAYDVAAEKFGGLTVGIKDYGSSIGDARGANEATERWREACKM